MTYSSRELVELGVPAERIALRTWRRATPGKRARMRQRELAALIGISLGALAKYERGETRRPHLATRIKIQEFLRSRGVL